MINSPYTVRQSRGGESTRPKAFKPIRWGHSEQEIGHEHNLFLPHHCRSPSPSSPSSSKWSVMHRNWCLLCITPERSWYSTPSTFCKLVQQFPQLLWVELFLKTFLYISRRTQRVQCHCTIIIHAVSFPATRPWLDCWARIQFRRVHFHFHNVWLCASCAQPGAGISKNVTDIHFFVLKGVPTDLLDV